MNSEWWKKVEEVYHAARELSGQERSRFLDAACMTDVAMRRQIEVLLQQDENPDSFLNKPAVKALLGHRGCERIAVLSGGVTSRESHKTLCKPAGSDGPSDGGFKKKISGRTKDLR